MNVGELKAALKLVDDETEVIMCSDFGLLRYDPVCDFDSGFAHNAEDGETIYDPEHKDTNAICFWPDTDLRSMV